MRLSKVSPGGEAVQTEEGEAKRAFVNIAAARANWDGICGRVPSPNKLSQTQSYVIVFK